MKYRDYPHDPVLVRANFRCQYCGKDLLSDLDTFLSITRDHLIPAAAGGANHHDNRVASCAPCDRLKADFLVVDLDQARRLVSRQRQTRAVWLERIRAEVRG